MFIAWLCSPNCFMFLTSPEKADFEHNKCTKFVTILQLQMYKGCYSVLLEMNDLGCHSLYALSHGTEKGHLVSFSHPFPPR